MNDLPLVFIIISADQISNELHVDLAHLASSKVLGHVQTMTYSKIKRNVAISKHFIISIKNY